MLHIVESFLALSFTSLSVPYWRIWFTSRLFHPKRSPGHNFISDPNKVFFNQVLYFAIF